MLHAPGERQISYCFQNDKQQQDGIGSEGRHLRLQFRLALVDHFVEMKRLRDLKWTNLGIELGARILRGNFPGAREQEHDDDAVVARDDVDVDRLQILLPFTLDGRLAFETIA